MKKNYRMNLCHSLGQYSRAAACLLGLLLFAASVRAEKVPGYTATLSNDSIHIKGERVTVAFRLDLGEQVVRTQHKRIVTPVITTADATRSVSLPAVVVNGRNRAIKEQRAGQQADDKSAYLLLTGNRNRYVDYRMQVDYEPWMEEARLVLREQVTGCACGDLLTSDQVVSDRLLYSPALELSSQMACPVEYRPRQEQRDAYLIYPVDRTTLLPDRYGNRRELEKIDSALTYVQHNPDYEIHYIAIAGYASPEGSLSHNIELSEGRAAALKNYIARKYAFPDSLLVVTPGAENWDGLVEALKSFELPYKDEILQTIGRIDDLDRREEAIRQIGGGVPYQTLLHAIYPSLRKNTFTVAYISRERTPEKARELVFTHPEELNVHEFYTVAERFYADDPDTYARVLMTAADTYPQHSIANNNAARVCIQNGELEKAEHYLLHTQNEPFTWNNCACLLWKQGQLSDAILWWRKAAENGDEQARHNLAEAEKRGY